MKKGIATITSEIILTIIAMSLMIPLLAYMETLGDKYNANDVFSSPSVCVTYRYIDFSKILLYNGCSYDIKVYSLNGLKINYSILYYNDTIKSFTKTSIIHSKALHLLILNISSPKIILNTSHGILVLTRR